jgi:ribosome-binding protein aMBF1 (putative translation factor)
MFQPAAWGQSLLGQTKRPSRTSAATVKPFDVTRVRKDLGEAIRERRVAMNIGQEELAELLYVRINYVDSIERGEQNVTITLDRLCRICTLFECSLSELFAEAGL